MTKIIIDEEEVEPFDVNGVPALNRKQAAKFLGISTNGIHYRAKRLGVRRIKSYVHGKYTFYAVAQLQAMKKGLPTIPPVEEWKDIPDADD